MAHGTAIIVGVGPGLGMALARAFANDGHDIALVARTADKLAPYVEELTGTGVKAGAYAADAGDPDSLRSTLRLAIDDLGAPEVLLYNAAVLRTDTPLDGDDEGWANALAVDVLGAKVAAETVVPAFAEGKGTLLFTGGGLAVSPSPEYASLSVGKAALRAYVTTLHDAHAETDIHATSVTIDGGIGGGEDRFEPDAIASRYLALHRQPRSDWSHELVLD